MFLVRGSLPCCFVPFPYVSIVYTGPAGSGCFPLSAAYLAGSGCFPLSAAHLEVNFLGTIVILYIYGGFSSEESAAIYQIKCSGHHCS